MPSEHHDWDVPAPLRALLWWPPVAFVVAMVDPTAAAGTIALAGAALAVLGVVGAAAGRAIARRMAPRGIGEPTLVLAGAPDSVTPLAAEQQAA